MNRLAALALIGAALGGCASAPPQKDGACNDACLEAKGQPVPIVRRNPLYPQAALDRKLGGCVVVSFEILPDGTAERYQILDSQPKGVFDQATLVALNGWRFRQPQKPGRYAQALTYTIASGTANETKCIETPTYEQLNGIKYR